MNANQKPENYACLAVDLGASSGRVIIGNFDGNKISLQEAHRFPNGPVEKDGTLFWDFQSLMNEIKLGLKKGIASARKNGAPVRSIGIDSWGVDFGLLDENGNLVSDPVHYRDKRTQGVMEYVFKNKISAAEIFIRTGIQFLPFNSVYQLFALKQTHPEQLQKAQCFLMMSNLVEYMLTGVKSCEFTNATTTQLYDPRKRGWADDLIRRLDLPRSIFPKIVKPGTKIAPLKPDVAEELGSHEAQVISVATHDTGSAVCAVPTLEKKFAYLSSGTWSLLGTEVKKPVITPRALELNFTNEGGVEDTYRLLKNIMGLWLLQESRAEWERQGRKYSWEQITEMGEKAQPFMSFIDPDDTCFLPPGDMTDRIRAWCKLSGQNAPETDAAIVRCVMESLAMKYRDTIMQLEDLTKSSLGKLHIVGGGVQNDKLCQWTADATGREVIAGPVEATAIGNIGMQLLSAGMVKDLWELRRRIHDSFSPRTYAPKNASKWLTAYAKYKSIRIKGDS
ncbi:rhamnulokinase [Candidatus Sumerlaeota bacterium]|nr:rhamnulokinase [Candidatus Sumerlaeota bacterium]